MVTTDKSKSNKSSSKSSEILIESWKQACSTNPSSDNADYMIDPSQIRGRLPDDLLGTIYFNGPAKHSRSTGIVHHPMDADGMVNALSFYDASVWFRNRYVQTRWFQQEEKQGKFMYRGAFRAMKPGGNLANLLISKIKYPCNMGVAYWSDKMVALSDGGLPHLMDPWSLATLSSSRFANTLPEEHQGGFCSTPKIDFHENRNLFVGMSTNVTTKQVTFYEYDRSFQLSSSQSISLDRIPLIHDFGLTPHFYILVVSAYDFDSVPYTMGQKPLFECVTLNPSQDTKIVVIPRKKYPISSKTIKATVPKEFRLASPLVCHHVMQAYEVQNERDGSFNLVLDLVGSNTMPRVNPTNDASARYVDQVDWTNGMDVPVSNHRRVTLDLGNMRADVMAENEMHCGMPCVNVGYNRNGGTPGTFIYSCVHVNRDGAGNSGKQAGNGVGPFNAIQKTCMDRQIRDVYVSPNAECIYGPVVYIPRSRITKNTNKNKDKDENDEFITLISEQEDDGYIVTVCTNGMSKTTSLDIFDACALSSGPICTIDLNAFVPLMCGCVWVDRMFKQEEVRKKTSSFEIFAKKGWNEMDSSFSSFSGNSLK